ncbi:hypothetical protein HID58_007145, partial [Brassica napus]
LNPVRLPPVLPPTQTRFNGTLQQEQHFATLLVAPHSMVNREPPQATQEILGKLFPVPGHLADESWGCEWCAYKTHRHTVESKM